MQTWIWVFRFLCAALALLAAFLLYRALLHAHPRGGRRGPRSGLALPAAAALACPESAKESRRARGLFPTRRHWRQASVAVAGATLAYFAGQAPSAIRSGTWWSIVPTPALG